MSKQHIVEMRVVVKLRVTDPDVIARTQTSEWQEQMYTFDEAEAASHIAWNVGVNDIALPRLEGWADCEPGAVEVLSVDRWTESVEVSNE